MPEEKKDSFTFSDKIKSSKPVASKSFGNRISSKIGSNGKPKKTLFERTKRDAPFFIAAIAALLLLPFLYKYSGQVNEEPIATPGSEESVFDPERYGFDTTTTDPDGQIAQLAGRDPLSLIKGWGSPEPEQPLYSEVPPHDGLDGGGYNPPVTESNINNYRNTAPAATRASFRRAATKIKELGNAGMASRGGGQLAVGPWGGGLKKAASRVGGPAGPRSGPKPVSLQPLQAAGKPSRSYFGQGAAAEARRSKDALSKGNAMQALMDAQMRPVDPGKIGGLGGTDYRGGGNGDLKHAFAYNGLKPWWWDLMAQKHMHDWMWKRNLWQKPITMLVEGLAKGLVEMFSGIVGCLLTGEDDFSMGSMFGSSASGGTAAGCKIQGKGDPMPVDQACGGDNYDFERCGGTKEKPNAKVYKQWCKNGGGTWEDGKGAGGNLNAWQKRMWCLGNTVKGGKGKAEYGLNEGSFCVNFQKDNVYQASLDANRDTSKWALYHYVVGVHQADVAKYYKQTSLADRNDMLYVFYMDEGGSFNPTTTDAYKKAVANTKMVPMFVESIALKKSLKDTDSNKSATKDKAESEKLETANALVFASKKKVTASSNNKKGEAVTKQVNTVESQSLPMSYNKFRLAFETGRNFLKDSSKEKLVKAGREGKDWVAGAQCDFPLVHVKCPYNAEVVKDGNKYPYATVIMSDGVLANYDQLRDNVSVWYSVQKDGKFPITQPDAVKINHFNPKAYGKARENPTKDNRRGAAFADPTLSGEAGDNAFDVYASKGFEPGKPTVIRWYIQQGEGVNEGKNNIGTISQKAGDKVIGEGLAVPGTTVSIAECTYYNDGQDEAVTQLGDPGACKDGETQVIPGLTEKNPKCVRTCRSGKYVDPLVADCPELDKGLQSRSGDVKKTVFFEQDIAAIPTVASSRENKPLDYKLGSKLPYDVKFSTCKLDNEGISSRRVFMDDDVKAFLKQAKAAYDASTNQSVLSYTENGTTIGNLVDAIQINAKANPSAQVPLNVVCMLGKSIGAASRDPNAKGSPAGRKGYWDNMFGTFAAFIDEDSSFFPSSYVTWYGTNARVKDERFSACNGKGGVIAGKDKKYHYGHYNWNEKRLGDLKLQKDRQPYEEVLRNGPWKTKPLADIGKAVGFQRCTDAASCPGVKSTNGTLDDMNRQLYHSKYKKVFQLRSSCDLSGGISAENALSYIQSLCENGSSLKPDNGNHLECGSRYKESQFSTTASESE